MKTLEKPEPASATTHTLTAMDRCDRCGGQAYVETSHSPESSTLLWCAHHYRHHKDAIVTSGGVVVVDETARLLTPLMGAY